MPHPDHSYNMNSPADADLQHSSADHEAFPRPSNPKCIDSFRIAVADPWTINSGSWCLPFSFSPKLCFHITRAPLWTEGSIYPVYNIWRPAYFGISLPSPDSRPYKLGCNDLIITSYEEDLASLNIGDRGPIPFERENIVSGIHVIYPPLIACKCCFRNRGSVTLANSERWRFDEIDQSYYQFQRLYDPKLLKADDQEALIWECYEGWKPSYGKAPAGLPFTMDQETRLCRINNVGEADFCGLTAPVLGIMNRESVVFVDSLEEATRIETANLRELILMTGLAVAKFERCI